MPIPQDNKIHFSGFWVVEFFTPNNIDNLNEFLKDSKMQDSNQMYFVRDTADKILENYRQEKITGDFLIGKHTHSNSKYFKGSLTIIDLPSEFEMIQVRGVQVNPRITAIVLKFELKDDFRDKLNELLHEDNDASIKFDGKLLHVNNKREAKIKNIKKLTLKSHNSARKWINKNFNGYFASNDEEQPIYDFFN